ncbi:MAG: hypothetical protein F4181_01550, partial [Proteobacteria bacterium]|nr:hypothetical protein [Pseudomonadota bacterium]
MLLATTLETVHAQSGDLFFEGVLLVEPAPPAEVVIPVTTGNAMGGGQNAMGMGPAMGGGGQSATGADGGQGGMGG